MKASYAIEAILIAGCFFMLIGLFARVYSQMGEAEKGISLKMDIDSDAELISSRINTLYYTGQGGQYAIERRTDARIEYKNGRIYLTSGNTTAGRDVMPEVEIISQGKRVIIEYNAGKAVITGQ